MLAVDPEKQKGQEEANLAEHRSPRHGRTRSSNRRESSRDLELIKDKLAGLFIPGKLREQSQEAVNENQEKGSGPALLQWTVGFQPRGKGEISEHCRHAFTAACHLLLESTTFPVYYTEKESQELHSNMFENTTGTLETRTPHRMLNLDYNENEVFLFLL